MRAPLRGAIVTRDPQHRLDLRSLVDSHGRPATVSARTDSVGILRMQIALGDRRMYLSIGRHYAAASVMCGEGMIMLTRVEYEDPDEYDAAVNQLLGQAGWWIS